MITGDESSVVVQKLNNKDLCVELHLKSVSPP